MDISNLGNVYKGNGYTVKHRPSIVKDRITRTLLNNPEGSLTKYRISKISNCKYPTVHRILKELEEMRLIKGTKVENFRRLMLAWKTWQLIPTKKEYLIKNPIGLLKRARLEYALTTYQGENLVQKYLVPTMTDFYIHPQDKLPWHRLILSQDGLVGKGNTRILIGDEHVFYNSIIAKELRIASFPQLILDLLNEGGVCVEAADYLLEKMEQHALPKL